MVGPRSPERQQYDRRRLAVGFVSLVGVSASLMAAYGGATLLEIGIVGGFGLLVGVVLVFAIAGSAG